MLGVGTWHAYITGRGGSPVKLELPFESISGNNPIDGTGQARGRIPAYGSTGMSSCEVVNEIEPWRDELVIYRDHDVAFVGPVVQVDADPEQGGSIFAQNLFHWMEKRWIERNQFYSWDIATTFRLIMEEALRDDPSPNIEVISHEVGIKQVVQVVGKEFPRAADLLRSLNRTGLDFATVNRTVYVGGDEIYVPNEEPMEAIVLHDGGVTEAPVTKDGTNLATDVAVFGEAVFVGSENRIYGRATRLVDEYGLLQNSFAELEIRSTPAANSAAMNRLRSNMPIPKRSRVRFTPQADCEFTELVPARRMDCRLVENGCLSLTDEMRVGEMSFEVNNGQEQISATLIPLGEFENG